MDNTIDSFEAIFDNYKKLGYDYVINTLDGNNYVILNNNIFGMKHPKIRETTAICEGKSGYAKYKTWIQSVEDYQHWQDFFLKDKEISRQEYLNLLGRIYATDKNYVLRLNRKIKEYRHIIG